MTPEEARPPPIATRANALQVEHERLGFDDDDSLASLHRDPSFCERHEAMLPPSSPRKRGEIDPDRALAEAKVVEAETIDEAVAWLKPKERMVVLHDRALLDLLARLKSCPKPA
jgi:membrane glycosyltransferase